MGKGALEDLVASPSPNVQNMCQCVCSCVCVEEVRGGKSITSWVHAGKRHLWSHRMTQRIGILLYLPHSSSPPCGSARFPPSGLHPATELPATSALGGVAASVSKGKREVQGSLFHVSCLPREARTSHACWTLLALVSPAAPSLRAARPVRPCGPSQTMIRCWGRSRRCCSGSATTTLITRERARRSSTRPHRLCCCRRSTASSCASTATPSSTRFAARGV